MKQYIDLMEYVLQNGVHKGAARTNMPGTLELFGMTFKHNLSDGFPLLTTKKMPFKLIAAELLWFLRGDTNIQYLMDNKCNIWNQDTFRKFCADNAIEPDAELFKQFQERNEQFNYDDYECGHIYGYLWRNWDKGRLVKTGRNVGLTCADVINYPGVDQICTLLNIILKNPNSRYQIVSAWNPYEIDMGDIALPSCHCFWQTNITKGRLNLALYQRSTDVPLGLPFNIASYALLMHILATLTGYDVGEFTWIGGSVHIYDNQVDTAKLQITRKPNNIPELVINMPSESASLISKCIDKREYTSEELNEILKWITPESFEIRGYNPWGKLNYTLSTGL